MNVSVRALLAASPSLMTAALFLCPVAACGSAADNSTLFTESSANSASRAGASSLGGGRGGEAESEDIGGGEAGKGAGALGGSAAGEGGASSGEESNAGAANAGTANAGGGAASGGAAGGGAAGGGAAGGGAGSGNAGAPNGGASGNTGLGNCATHGANASFFSKTQHCYLVVHDEVGYASAQQHCAALGAHLVTTTSDEENDFVWALQPSEHWIGASDGKGPKETAIGTYAWITGEPFTYTAWSAGQPNASKTTCVQPVGPSFPGGLGGSDCYEHCAFQWAGGERPGQWNDRYCQQTTDSICEWE